MPENFIIEKKGDKPIIIGRVMFDQWFSQFPDETRFTVEFRKLGKSRTNRQNSYYWAVIVKSFQIGALEQWGEYLSPDDCHFTLKAKFMAVDKVNEDTGEVISVIGSTSDNDTWDQEEYHDKCRKLIYDFFNIAVPLPNEGQVEIFN